MTFCVQHRTEIDDDATLVMHVPGSNEATKVGVRMVMNTLGVCFGLGSANVRVPPQNRVHLGGSFNAPDGSISHHPRMIPL